MSEQPLDEGFDELFRPKREPGQETMVIEPDPAATAPAGGPLSRLEARNVSAWFGDHKVLERVSLDMEPGTVTALIGPSGCGNGQILEAFAMFQRFALVSSAMARLSFCSSTSEAKASERRSSRSRTQHCSGP